MCPWERERFFRSSRHAELMEVILHPNEITMVLDRTHTHTDTDTQTQFLSVALLTLSLSLSVSLFGYDVPSKVRLCATVDHASSLWPPDLSYYKISRIADIDLISTLLLAWEGNLSLALLVYVAKLDILLDAIKKVLSLCYLLACSTFLMNIVLLQWDLKPGKWNSTLLLPNIYDLTKSIQSQCKKQKSECTQTHKYTHSHMNVDTTAYFQMDIRFKINVPRQT